LTANEEEPTAGRDPGQPSSTRPGLGGRLRVGVRSIQIGLGLLWILDGLLQLQPRMFTHELIDSMIRPMAGGQPAPVAWSITAIGHFLRPDVGVWNFLFAAVQLAIGVGLMMRRTLRPALIAMWVWAFGVWWVGEGFGMLLTGTANPLTGAPGAVVLYAAIGLMIWPTGGQAPDEDPGEPPTGLGSSAAGAGLLGAIGLGTVWAAYWLGSAVLWLLPANRQAGSVHDTVSSMAAGQPSWYVTFLNHVASGLAGHGTQIGWVAAALSIAIGLGPLLARRATPFLLAGAALSVAYWVIGQALGGVLTGMGTDPNAGPLVVLLAAALLPHTVAVTAGSPSPVGRLARTRPLALGGAIAGLAAALLLAATYPAHSPGAADQPTSTASAAPSGAMSAMPGMSAGTAGSGTAGTGAAASDPASTWRYSGPAIPASEATLLTGVFQVTEAGHAMQTESCTTPATPAQLQAAMQLVQQTSSAVAKYRDQSVAKADGYVPITSTSYPVVHWIKGANFQARYVLDPAHIQSLVYATTPTGPVLVAGMYLMPRAGDVGPMPGGCLTQWHAHTNLCRSDGGVISGFAQNGICPDGLHPSPTPEMLHVWQVPVPGGPLTMDPSDLQVVEAALMATSPTS